MAILLLIAGFILALISIYLVPRKEMKTLTIIRGIPGSGKSTLAASMADKLNIPYFENDQFIYNEQGVYEWSPERVSRAIDDCYAAVETKVLLGDSVIVSNVFSRWKSLRDYVELGQTHNYEVHIIECTGDYGSIHGLTDERMAKFRTDFIHNENLPAKLSVKYSKHPS